MNKTNKNNEAKYICLLCIQLYEEPPFVMALVDANGAAATGLPKKHYKMAPPHKTYCFISL